MVPLVVATWRVLFAGHRSSSRAALAFVDLLTWQVAAVAVSAVTSRVLFGLRAEIADTRRLGQYTLEEKIGEGGMGVVYRAHHAMLRRPTAIKLLPLAKAGAENLLRFEREVQLTASLTHPNTVAVFDYGRTVEGVFYYAMEYLDGINLDQLVRADGPQPPGRVVRILQQASGALAEAHQIGLVHRDIKPANIILCERGGVPDVVKVVDFGLVKRVRTDDDAMTMAVTTEQTLLGTPLYMSPESISGTGEVGAPSDLYALGAVALSPCRLRLLSNPATRRVCGGQRRRGGCLSAGQALEQGIALLFLHAADDRTGPPRAPAHHFLGKDVDLPPALLLQEADRGAEHHGADAAAEDGRLAHGARLRRRVEDEAGSAVAATRFSETVDGVDLPVPRRIDRRLVPPLGHHLTRIGARDQGAERQTGQCSGSRTSSATRASHAGKKSGSKERQTTSSGTPMTGRDEASG